YLSQARDVFFFILLSFTWSFAITQMILQANFKFSPLNIPQTKVEVAGAELNCCLNKIKQLAHFRYRSKRPQILRAVIYFSSCQEDPREMFIFENHVGLRLIILKIDVKAWLKLFYQ